MASCPNINSQEWKDLVAEIGEVSAYALYIRNGYQIPTGDYGQVIEGLDKKDVNQVSEERAKAMMDITKVRRKILTALKTKFSIYEGSKNEEYVQNLIKLIQDFENADVTRSMMIFIDNAEKNIKALTKRMHLEKDNLELLKKLDNFIGTFELIEDLGKFADVHLHEDNTVKGERNKKIRSRIGLIKHELDSFRNQYLNYGKETIVNRLAAESTLIRTEYRDKFAREFETNLPANKDTRSKDVRESEKRKYIQRLLNENNAKILREEKEYVRQLLSTAPKDIDSITAAMVDPRSTNDHIIQLAIKVLDRRDKIVENGYFEDRNEAYEVFKEFAVDSKGVVITDQRKLYEDIIEVIDGQPTGYVTGPVYSTFYASLNEVLTTVRKTKDPKKGHEILHKWKKENLINPSKGWNNTSNIKTIHRNPSYVKILNDPRKFKFYKWYTEFNKESDNMVHNRNKLGFRLPGITKETSESFNDNGILNSGTRMMKDAINIQADDFEYGETDKKEGKKIVAVVDEKGKTLKKIIVPFRSKLDIKDQSFDLIGMALANRYVSRNYKEKSAVKADLEILKDLMAERRVKVTKGFANTKVVQRMKAILNVSEEEEQELETKNGLESNSYRAYNNIIESRLYGKDSVSVGSVLGVSVDKATKMLIKVSADNMLIANMLGAKANVLNGKMMNFFESVRGTHFGTGDLIVSEKKYFGDMGNIMNDIGKFRPESKTNMFLERFGTHFEGFMNSLTKDNRFKRLFNTGTLHGLNTSAEHWIQGTIVYAYFNNIKIQNKNGDYVDANGRVVSREKAMSFDEAFEVKNGALVWKNKDFTPEGFESYNEDVEFMISRKLKDMITQLQGNYEGKNKSNIERYWYGKLGTFLRKWMVRGVQRRWRGIQHSGTNYSDLDRHLKFYSESTQEFTEGTYTSTVRFMMNLYKYGKLLQAQTYSKNWKALSEMEKANIKSAAAEFTTMIAAIIASNLLKELGDEEYDEEDKDSLYEKAYLFRRLYGELMFYTPANPAEAIRILKTPSATMSTVELATDTFYQYFYDIFSGEPELYQTGRRAGESKSWVLTNRLFNPFEKNMFGRDAQESLKYLTNAQ